MGEVRITATHGPTTLSKLGADLRWFLEQNGVDAERVIFTIGVQSKYEQDKVISGFYRGFDQRIMRRNDKYDNCLWLHGVPVVAVINSKPKEPA